MSHLNDIIFLALAIPIGLLMIGNYLWCLITDPKGFFLSFFVMPIVTVLGPAKLLYPCFADQVWLRTIWLM